MSLCVCVHVLLLCVLYVCVVPNCHVCLWLLCVGGS